MAGKFMLVVAAPHHMGLSVGCLGVLTTWLLASPEVSDPRQRTSSRNYPFYDQFQKSHTIILFINGKALSPAHIHGKGNISPFEIRDVKELVDIYLNNQSTD